MVAELLQGIYGALGQLFYIPFISDRIPGNETRAISKKRRAGTNASGLENYLGMHGLSFDSID